MSNEFRPAPAAGGAAGESIAKRLFFLDRYLTRWIFIAMAVVETIVRKRDGSIAPAAFVVASADTSPESGISFIHNTSPV